ncbi:MAG: hypothetical protein H6709_07900 [Kofleriaceae bacterium]|nr:hypothetical protein [Kofleriaceae bacterium]
MPRSPCSWPALAPPGAACPPRLGRRHRPPPPPPEVASTEAWPVRCAAELDAGAAVLARRDPVFAGARAIVLTPAAGPPRPRRPGILPSRGPSRHAGGVSWDLQLLDVPEYFYIDIHMRVDDDGGWAALAGDGRWACRTRGGDGQRDAQRHVECVRRHGDRIAVVRAIHWRPSRRVARYLDVLGTAAAWCLDDAGPD